MTTSAFNSAVKPLIDLIPGSKKRNTETEDHVLSLTHIANNFVSTSTLPDVFCSKLVLEIFRKFTAKHLCLSLYLAK